MRAGTKTALVAAAVAVAVTAAAAWGLQAHRAGLREPLPVTPDGLQMVHFARIVLDSGWHTRSDRLAAPFAADMHDFSLTDSLTFAAFRTIGLVIPDPAAVVNVYLFLTYALTAAAGVVALRRLGLSLAAAACGGALFALLPFHQFRGIDHLFQSAYFLVPAGVIVAVRLATRARPGLSVWWVAAAALLSSTSVYFAYFAAYLWAVAAALGCLRWRTWRPAASAAVLVAVMTAGVLLNGAEAIRYRLEQGTNLDVLDRPPEDAETYALKVAHLLLPIRGHALPALDRLRRAYGSAGRPLENENVSASLGAVGAAGFLLLIGVGVVVAAGRGSPPPSLLGKGAGGLGGFQDNPSPGPSPKRGGVPASEGGVPSPPLPVPAPPSLLGKGVGGLGSSPADLLRVLAALVAALLLLGVIGGFGSLVSYLALPQIRAYNRASIWIGFLALAAAMLVLDLGLRRVNRPLRWLIAIGLTALGTLDQTGWTRSAVAKNRTAREETAAAYAVDRDFYRDIEQRLPANGRVAQVPYIGYPDSLPPHTIELYDHLKGFVHTTQVKWSGAAMNGREPAHWQRRVLHLPPARMLPLLAMAGFDGLLVNRGGYPNHGKAFEEEVARELGHGPALVHPSGGYAFFAFDGYAEAVRKRFAADDYERSCENVRNPLFALWQDGFYCFRPPTDPDPGRVAQLNAKLLLVNPTGRTRRVELTVAFRPFGQLPLLPLHVGGPLVHAEWQVNSMSGASTLAFELPPGRHPVEFRGTTPPGYKPTDPRRVVYHVSEFALRDVTDPNDKPTVPVDFLIRPWDGFALNPPPITPTGSSPRSP